MFEDYVEIESPEKIIFQYRIAQIGTRIGAYLLDLVLQVLVLLLAFLFITLIVGRRANPLPQMGFSGGNLYAVAFLYLLYFFMQWGYFAFFEAFKNGQSPGKRLMGIRVIRANGEPLDLSSIFLRNLVRAVDQFPTLNFLGGLVAMMDKKSRRFGDVVADTLVVYDIHFDLKEPDFKTILADQNISESMVLLEKLDEEELYVVRRFLNERIFLPETRQRTVARQLADKVSSRLKITSPYADPIKFLESIYKKHVNENNK